MQYIIAYFTQVSLIYNNMFYYKQGLITTDLFTYLLWFIYTFMKLQRKTADRFSVVFPTGVLRCDGKVHEERKLRMDH